MRTLLTLCLLPLAAHAQPVIDFVTVGSAGNRATIPSEVPQQPDMQAGAVNYEFRISQTEVLVEDWLPFVQAYAPFWTGSPFDSRFTSNFIFPNGSGGYNAAPGTERYPVDISWIMAARYVNWLHNGAVVGHEPAFSNGAYDISTFTLNPDGSWNGQATHSSDASYWIPTFDETFKAFYHDPNRYGSGQEGYWLYPNGSNVPSVSGPPGIGTTNAGLGSFSPYSVAGQYPEAATPWDLLDASGGENEYTETADFFGRRYSLGTSLGTSPEMIQFFDRADWFRHGEDLTGSLAGFRVATSIPHPPVVSLFVITSLFAISRKRSRWRRFKILIAAVLGSLFAVQALGQITTCGGSGGCGSGANVCIFSPIAVTVISPCTDNILEISVTPGDNQSPSVTINVYASNFVFDEIRIRNMNASSTVSVLVQPAGSGSIASIGSIYQSGGSGDVWISGVYANQIGGIAAEVVSHVEALTGNITGPIVSYGSSSGRPRLWELL